MAMALCRKHYKEEDNTMSLFKKRKAVVHQYGAVHSTGHSCRVKHRTGEKTIGFYDRSAHRLRYAELVRSEQDVLDFFAQYGETPDTEILRKLITD